MNAVISRIRKITKFMSEKNLIIIGKLYQALNKKDLPFLLSITDPEIVISQTGELPWGGNYQGIDGLKKFLAALSEHTDSSVTVNETFEAGEEVIVIGRSAGRTRAFEIPFDVRVVHVWTLWKEKIVRFQPFIDTPAMLRALSAKGV
jgi:uncharacterized protein